MGRRLRPLGLLDRVFGLDGRTGPQRLAGLLRVLRGTVRRGRCGARGIGHDLVPPEKTLSLHIGASLRGCQRPGVEIPAMSCRLFQARRILTGRPMMSPEPPKSIKPAPTRRKARAPGMTVVS